MPEPNDVTGFPGQGSGEHFYVLEGHFDDSEADSEVMTTETTGRGEVPLCPVCGRYMSLIPWAAPYTVELTGYRKCWADVMVAGEMLVMSEAARGFWVGKGFRGVDEFIPLEAELVRRRPRMPLPPPYYLAKMSLKQIWMDEPASGAVREPGQHRCDHCGGDRNGRVVRAVLDVSTWDGSDAFRCINLSGTVWMSAAAVESMRAASLKFAAVQPALEFGYDYSRGEW